MPGGANWTLEVVPVPRSLLQFHSNPMHLIDNPQSLPTSICFFDAKGDESAGLCLGCCAEIWQSFSVRVSWLHGV